MEEKILDAIDKLKSTVACTSAASVCYNMHLITKVYFGTGVIKLMPKQEEILKKTCEPV